MFRKPHSSCLFVYLFIYLFIWVDSLFRTVNLNVCLSWEEIFLFKIAGLRRQQRSSGLLRSVPGPIDCPETSERNNQDMLRNIPEERRSQVLLCSFFLRGCTALVGLGLIVTVSTSHSAGLLWTSDRPIAAICTRQNIHKRKTSMPPAGFESAIQQVSGRRSTPLTARPPGSALFCDGLRLYVCRTSDAIVYPLPDR